MGILIDPRKQLINITHYFVAEKRTRGNAVYHFIKTQDTLNEWKAKGYRIEGETQPQETLSQPPLPIAPGSPIQKSDDPTKVISKVTVTWKLLSWGEQNSILSQSYSAVVGTDGKTTRDFDPIKYRDLKLKTGIKKWSITDDDGHEIPVTNDTIDMLPPEFAVEFLSAFEQVAEAGEEELKK